MARCGLFGKLPAKRDFIALQAPRGFLEVWEPWMQAGMSASRVQLGEIWQKAYLRAPIWRFWLGADLCGNTVAGAFMPSLDGIGRYYPLTLFACNEDGGAIPPPELDSQDDWFAAAEEMLLSTLESGVPYESITIALEQLPPPTDSLTVEKDEPVANVAGGAIVAATGGPSFSRLFAALRVSDYARAYSASTFWWTIGGEDCPAVAISELRMPEPFLFANMLTGRFGSGNGG